jgi:hypothetical protein
MFWTLMTSKQEDSGVWKWRQHVLDFGILLGCHKQLPDEEALLLERDKEIFWCLL